MLDAVVQYTEIPVYPDEVVIAADSAELASFPFLFMTGHKLVRFSDEGAQGLVRYVENGGLLFSDDCNHDVDGLYAKSFEAEMHRAFPGPDMLAKIPNSHRALSRRSSSSRRAAADEPRAERLGRQHRARLPARRRARGRLGVVYSNKDYGCEWDYDWRNKRFRTRDNTKFAVNLVVYAMT